ncbi:MAG: GspE/PulE family protein [bacterium]
MTIFQEENQKTKLDEIRKKEEEEVAQLLSKRHNLPYLNLYGIAINTDALRLISEADARSANIAAFNSIGKKLDVGILSPKNELTMQTMDNLDRKGYDIRVFMVSENSLAKAWSHYKDISLAEASRAGALEISVKSITDFIATNKTLEDIKKTIADAIAGRGIYRTSVIIEDILAGAITTNASDVHIEPEEGYARVRYRLDGVLVDVLQFDLSTLASITSRLKLVAGMKLNIKDKAQDGRFSIKLPDTEFEIRASILPGAYNESFVLRLLNPKSIQVPLEEMGIEPTLYDALMKEISKPNGMLLNTGPTGSGKTTTLYSFLRKIHTPEVKIITIEDPIEYHLPGIVQTQVDQEKGYDFLAGLRASLRQDPDVIMVGEIRDDETAKIAVQSALTGHLVFSTLHTNNAAGTYARLINLGVSPKDISPALNVALAQRLCRKLCQYCKKEVVLVEEKKDLFNKIVVSIRNKKHTDGLQIEKMYEAVGCEKCHGLGYKGRIGIFEAIIKSNELEKLILNKDSSERDIKKLSLDQGQLDMRQDGIIKILQGITSLDELSRVIDINEEIL